MHDRADEVLLSDRVTQLGTHGEVACNVRTVLEETVSGLSAGTFWLVGARLEIAAAGAMALPMLVLALTMSPCRHVALPMLVPTMLMSPCRRAAMPMLVRPADESMPCCAHACVHTEWPS